jgi:hypothetical protein
MVIALILTGAAVWATRGIVHDQEHRLLKERTSEVNLVLTSAIGAIPATLDAQGATLRATGSSRLAYTKAAKATVAAGPGRLTFAWLRPNRRGAGYVVLAAAGTGLHVGQVVADARVRTFAAAARSGSFAATPVFGADRRLGFAVGSPVAPAGTVLYRESVLGPVSAPRQAATAPFAELDVALYTSSTAQPSQILTRTTSQLPLKGDVDTQTVPVGTSHWLLAAKARRSLVGSVATDAWWVVLIGGVLGSFLIGVTIETAARRRDAALALYEGEHQMAETLQRSLLPRLTALPSLGLAARYLAAGTGQEVGGDWFDAFPITGGRVGIVIGDVIGHDLEAASAMAQIRASLRAYAVDGDPPATVINRLDHLVDTFALTQLVTVIYGVLGPVAADGSRLLRWANAGHLPPLLRSPHGDVTALTGGDSVLLGAPIPVDHHQAERRLEPGSTLLLFTDGLVEVPGRALEETLAELAAALAVTEGAMDVEAMCERVVAGVSDRVLRDDIALLAIEILTPQAAHATPSEAQASH